MVLPDSIYNDMTRQDHTVDSATLSPRYLPDSTTMDPSPKSKLTHLPSPPVSPEEVVLPGFRALTCYEGYHDPPLYSDSSRGAQHETPLFQSQSASHAPNAVASPTLKQESVMDTSDSKHPFCRRPPGLQEILHRRGQPVPPPRPVACLATEAGARSLHGGPVEVAGPRLRLLNRKAVQRLGQDGRRIASLHVLTGGQRPGQRRRHTGFRCATSEAIKNNDKAGPAVATQRHGELHGHRLPPRIDLTCA
ncbi:hypothetical protein K431DRAFT_170444 [Polychaeton citri CBS 116435]|uniref:Uncharacterized protein n=1 Tax=Polychaeton citri CBS 116435 TaxID=1314669 RepID=A0A9P4UJW4_9PEZI|nr:hypothetical protein K431DRAFT_170444 [Polychaeton citri CBS 116435]